MTKCYLLLVSLFYCIVAFAQGTDFYGNDVGDICFATHVSSPGDQVAVFQKICADAKIEPGNIIFKPCPSVKYCYAYYVPDDFTSYLVYGPSFFKSMQTYDQNKGAGSKADWTAMAIFCHEMGKYLDQTFTDPSQAAKFSQKQLKLQADKSAGVFLHNLGATKDQVKKVMDGAAFADASLKNQRLEAIIAGYDLLSTPATATVADAPSNGKVTLVLPQFKIIDAKVPYTTAEQFKQVLANTIHEEATFNMVVSSYDSQNYKNDLALSYGGPDAIKRADYVLVGKIMDFEEKTNKVTIMGLTYVEVKKIYSLNFDLIDTKTGNLSNTKDVEVKVTDRMLEVDYMEVVNDANVKLEGKLLDKFKDAMEGYVKYLKKQKLPRT
jgi:hypothetical protein